MTVDIVSVFGPPAAVFFGAGGIGFVVGYAVKKVAKIIAVIVGLFFIGLAYLDHQGWAKIDGKNQQFNICCSTERIESNNHNYESYSDSSTAACDCCTFGSE